jgi:hypothetical protein
VQARANHQQQADRRRAVNGLLMPVLDRWQVPDAERRNYIQDCSEMAAAHGFAAMLGWLQALHDGVIHGR